MNKKGIELLKVSYGIILFSAMILSIVTMNSHPIVSRTLDTVIWMIFFSGYLVEDEKKWSYMAVY